MTAPSPVAPSRVLVTGAAGGIGRAVLDRFHTAGVPVTALVLEDPGGLPADRVVAGDAGDPAVVRDALDGVDAVVHLAALPSPKHADARTVFANNTQSTFVVLEEAGQAGVRRAVIASSYSILGIAWAERTLHPAYYPIDEDLPLQVEDPYALSKQVDEATARMVVRRYGMDVVALRYPMVGDERLAAHLEIAHRDPGAAAHNSWAYLHTLDAAEATWLAATVPAPGFHAVFVAAPEILSPYPTEDLIARFHPGTELRSPLPGRTVPIDTSAARELLGFTPRHLVEVEPQELALPTG